MMKMKHPVIQYFFLVRNLLNNLNVQTEEHLKDISSWLYKTCFRDSNLELWLQRLTERKEKIYQCRHYIVTSNTNLAVWSSTMISKWKEKEKTLTKSSAFLPSLSRQSAQFHFFTACLAETTYWIIWMFWNTEKATDDWIIKVYQLTKGENKCPVTITNLICIILGILYKMTMDSSWVTDIYW